MDTGYQPAEIGDNQKDPQAADKGYQALGVLRGYICDCIFDRQNDTLDHRLHTPGLELQMSRYQPCAQCQQHHENPGRDHGSRDLNGPQGKNRTD